MRLHSVCPFGSISAEESFCCSDWRRRTWFAQESGKVRFFKWEITVLPKTGIFRVLPVLLAEKSRKPREASVSLFFLSHKEGGFLVLDRRLHKDTGGPGRVRSCNGWSLINSEYVPESGASERVPDVGFLASTTSEGNGSGDVEIAVRGNFRCHHDATWRNSRQSL